MIYGGSSGGVCAWTAAWQHPDLFRRVFTAIGTYVGMRGADQYPTLIRKTEPKPIRIFQQDGEQDTWNPLFDNWYTQNRSMEESLSFAGYDVNHSWGKLGHEGSHAQSLFPDVMKWLWRDYPAPITAGVSGNSMLRSVLVPDQGWRPVADAAKSPTHLAVSPAGDVYVTDAGGTIHKIGSDGTSQVFARSPAPVTAQAFGPDGRLFAALTDGRIVAFNAAGKPAPFAAGVHAPGLYVANDGSVYASEPGAHDELPSRLWLLKANGVKTLLDTGLHHATGLLLTPDHTLLFAAEGRTHWIYSYAVLPAGTALADKQRFYWLHVAESATDEGDDSGATDLADDSQGNLYVATRMGVQICDRNGRVEGILTLARRGRHQPRLRWPQIRPFVRRLRRPCLRATAASPRRPRLCAAPPIARLWGRVRRLPPSPQFWGNRNPSRLVPRPPGPPVQSGEVWSWERGTSFSVFGGFDRRRHCQERGTS